jgi:hypothetical protein
MEQRLKQAAIDYYNRLPPNICICANGVSLDKVAIVNEIVNETKVGIGFVQIFGRFVEYWTEISSIETENA